MGAPVELLALKRFEGIYAQLDAALDAEDAVAVAALMTQRGAIIEELVALFGRGHELPATARERLAEKEARLTSRVRALRDKLQRELRDQRTRGSAVQRYSRVNRQRNNSGGQRG